MKDRGSRIYKGREIKGNKIAPWGTREDGEKVLEEEERRMEKNWMCSVKYKCNHESNRLPPIVINSEWSTLSNAFVKSM